VTVVATAGLSNPATLPMAPSGTPTPATERTDDAGGRIGTVNLLVGTTRSLEEGTLASLLGTAVEAKTATLLSETGFTGTTSDAVVAGCAPDGEPARFAGSATELGTATRACVREALRATLTSRYDDRELPPSVEEARYGTVTGRRASTFEVGR
jgi:adenosylcobinamide hydrolase